MADIELHAVEDAPLRDVPDVAMWSENYAFMTTDVENGIGIMNLLGRWTSEPHTWREFLLMGLPDGTIVYHRNFGRATRDAVASASLFRIEIDQPSQRFTLIYDGPVMTGNRADLLEFGSTDRPVAPCRMELTFDAVAPVWDMSGHSGNAEIVAGRMHVEQVGRVNGSVALHGRVHRINAAFGQRDHSRGPRVVTHFKRHCWAQGHFAKSDITFNLYLMEVYGGSGARMANASVSRGNQRYDAQIVEMPLMESREQGNLKYAFVLRSTLGEMNIETDRIITSLPVSFTSPWDVFPGVVQKVHSAASFEEAVVWRMNGETGSGWSERAFNHAPFPA